MVFKTSSLQGSKNDNEWEVVMARAFQYRYQEPISINHNLSNEASGKKPVSLQALLSTTGEPTNHIDENIHFFAGIVERQRGTHRAFNPEAA